MITYAKSVKYVSSAFEYFSNVSLKEFVELPMIMNAINELNEEDRITIATMKEDEFKEFFINHLLSFGWSDEEMIDKHLQGLKETYILSYEESNDQFKIQEIEK